jgi:hypothetical protein
MARNNRRASAAVPHDPRAEAALLGSAMRRRSALEVLATQTRPGEFFDHANQPIAAALLRLYEANADGHDAIATVDELIRAGELDQAGGAQRVLRLLADAPFGGAEGQWAQIIHNHAHRRRVRNAADMLAAAADPSADPAELTALVQATAQNIAANNGAWTYSTLRFGDIDAILDGTFSLEQPTILTRTDHRSLLYPGKMHFFLSDPSVGKSMLAQEAVRSITAAGGSAMYLDYEDTTVNCVNRIRALGGRDDHLRGRFVHVNPEAAIAGPELAQLAEALDRMNPDLVVIDGIAAALAREGLDENSNTDVAHWIERVPRFFTRSGAAVLMLDHVAKDREKRGRHARGAGHKLGITDGAAYEVFTIEPFSRHKPGRFGLRVAKDRPGAVGAIGEHVATIHVDPRDDGRRVLLRVAPVGPADPVNPDPYVLMGRISAVIDAAKAPVTMTSLRYALGDEKPVEVERALGRLMVDGYVAQTRSGNGAKVLQLLRPYDGGLTAGIIDHEQAEIDFDEEDTGA